MSTICDRAPRSIMSPLKPFLMSEVTPRPFRMYGVASGVLICELSSQWFVVRVVAHLFCFPERLEHQRRRGGIRLAAEIEFAHVRSLCCRRGHQVKLPTA